MPDKAMRMLRAGHAREGQRPVVLAIAGDSAAGKTTLTRGLVDALGGRATSICVDDYHRYDRQERKEVPFTPLHPDCNYVDIMEQHLQLLATGQPVLKPVYNHSTGELTRPELVEPQEFLIVEGLLPLHSKLSRACFDIAVFLDPPEEVRRGWKVRRDTTQRGYTEEQVLTDLDRREPDAAAFIRPQREYADIVVRFAPIEGRDEPGTPLSSLMLLRPTIRHPDFSALLDDNDNRAMHLKLLRDDDSRPVDALHVHGYVPPEESDALQRAVWRNLSTDDPLPASLGATGDDTRSAPLAMTQLLLLYHLLDGLP